MSVSKIFTVYFIDNIKGSIIVAKRNSPQAMAPRCPPRQKILARLMD